MTVDGTSNFFILGAGRRGTTSLYQYLSQHPDVLMSTPKEPVFFEAEYENGLAYYRDRYLKGWNGESALGEARPANLLLPYVAPRIRENFPDAKLVAILRNPVDRAYSHWWVKYCDGIEKRAFVAAVEENLARIASGVRFRRPGRGAAVARQPRCFKGFVPNRYLHCRRLLRATTFPLSEALLATADQGLFVRGLDPEPASRRGRAVSVSGRRPGIHREGGRRLQCGYSRISVARSQIRAHYAPGLPRATKAPRSSPGGGEEVGGRTVDGPRGTFAPV